MDWQPRHDQLDVETPNKQTNKLKDNFDISTAYTVPL